MRHAGVALFALSMMASAGAHASTTIIDPLTGKPIPNFTDARPMATPIPRETVSYDGPYGAGTIVVSTKERRLYLVQGDGKAIKYAVGVGRPGFDWGGSKTVTRKAEWPSWTPPAQMLRRRPDLPRFMPGGPENPMGARALYLGSSLYRIHGSNEPETIGQAVSSGCIRMLNEDVIDLYERVRVGARVVVIR
jgi:lipoprotein-anchoring transpeptidase ErfK/SrfK